MSAAQPEISAHLTIGLTGLIGAGKSTVVALMREHGAFVVDSDQLVRELQQPGSPCLDEIVAEFGDAILNADGTLDRRALASIVFSDSAALRRLEAILHPAVGRLRDERLAASSTSVRVVEAIKLIEVGYHHECDELWVVSAGYETRLCRLMASRGISREDADKRLRSQMAEEEMTRLADVVLRNDGSLDELGRQVDAHWQRLLQLLNAQP